MTFRKRKKNTRQRATQTHGWGAKKKHRGKGNKGGAGNAGSGKRGDAKKPSYWKEKYFGKKGFTSKGAAPDCVISLKDLLIKMDRLKKEKIAVEKNGIIDIDLSKMKVTKLLGTGNVTMKLNITVDKASEQAVEKVQQAGGQVICEE